MSINTKPGWLYFLRERDFRTHELSPYIKIGKTDHDRPVASRILDHQTGNPRLIFSVHNEQVCSIDTIETYLHHHYAPQRVYGEWFELDGAQIAKAISLAQKLNREIAPKIDCLEAIKPMAKITSDGIIRSATTAESTMIELWEVTKTAHVVAKGQKDLVTAQLRALMGMHNGIAGILEFITKFSSLNLDQKSLRQQHPDLVAQYTTTSTKVTGSFKAYFTNPQLRKVNEGLAAELREATTSQSKEKDPEKYTLVEMEADATAKQLHETYLESLADESRLSIELDLIKAELQALCGASEGIEGVCTWNRAEKLTESVDWKKLTEEHPQVVAQHQGESKQTFALELHRFRAY